MILINYTDSDPTSFLVFDWLSMLNSKYKLICDSDSSLSFKKIELSNNHTRLELNDIEFDCIHSYWNRRSDLVSLRRNASSNNNEYNRQFQLKEFSYIMNFINWYFEKKTSLNKFEDNNTNKLVNLMQASLLGIKIPNTIITSSKDELIHFIGQNEIVITKAINSGSFSIGNIVYSAGTILVDNNILNSINNYFLPSLFQQYVKKKIELRVFFLNGTFKSMAIFSQKNERTRIDFRNYDNNIPNRTIPFVLPEIVSRKLIDLMNVLGLKTGSIDLILTPDNEYVFLEVNPVGIYSQMSLFCNYFIERDIAEYLISNDKNG